MADFLKEIGHAFYGSPRRTVMGTGKRSSTSWIYPLYIGQKIGQKHRKTLQIPASNL